MGNQNCCISSARRELGHADFVASMNDPFRQHNPPIKRTPQHVIPEVDDPISCQTSGGYKQAKNEKAKNISLQQLQGNSHPAKKNKVVIKKKPPPLMDFDSAKDENTTATHTAIQLTSYAGGSNNQTVIHHQNGGEENVLDDDEEPQNHHEKDYWDVMDEDKNLSVRLSEKRIITREYYSCIETLAQEEQEAGPKTSIIEANSRKAVQKAGEVETEPEEEYEDDYFEISQSKDIMSSQKFNSRPSVTEQTAHPRFIKGKPESVSSRFEDSNLLTERLNQILTEERKGPLPLAAENKPPVVSVTKVEENNSKPRTSYHSFENSPMPQNARVLATPPTIDKEENMLRRTALEDKSAAKNHSIGCLDTTSVYAENTLRGGPESIKGTSQLIQLKSASKLAKQPYDDYEQRDHSPLKYSDLAEIKEEKSHNYNYNYQDHHLYKSIEIKQQTTAPTISPLKTRGVNVMSDNDLVNRILENRSISVTGLNQGKTRENWSKEIHNQLDTIRENIWQKRQIEKIVQQAQQNSQNSYREGSGNSFRAAKSVEKFASSLGENDPNYIIAQRKGIERASRLIQNREKSSDLSYHSRSRNSEVDISGSSMDLKDKSFSKRYENIVKDDVKKLMEKALNPKSKRLDVYLHQEREKRQGLSGREAQGKSDWKGLLQKKSDYSHPFVAQDSNLRAYSPERRRDMANIDISHLLKK